jgi:hypothetical protein
MQVDQVKVTSVRIGESFRNFWTRPGVLDIADRGYSNPPSIAAAAKQGGDVLVRWNFASLPLHRRNKKGDIDVHRATRGLSPGQRRELLVAVHLADGVPILGRLLVERLPNDQAEKARQRVRAEKGGALAVEMASFVMLFTTVPLHRLSADQLRRLYRLRWQVELEFKREKSITGLDMLPNFREDTIQAWLLAKLVLGQMARRLLDRESAHRRVASQSLRPRLSLAVAMPWQAAVAGWLVLRAGLLTIRVEHAALFFRRFHDQLARLRTAGKRAGRQTEDFLNALEPVARQSSA